MSNKKSYEEALASLTNVLSEREKDLELREEKLAKALKTYEAERSADYGSVSPSDVLRLNVGGTKTTVLRRTLTSVPGSMLASKFSGRWDDSLEKDKDGDIFIDQNFALFEPLLICLRDRANGTEKYPVSPPFKIDHYKLNIKDFYRMAEYYGVMYALYSTSLEIHTGSADFVEMDGPKKVNATGWTTFILARVAHNRYVKSYEVTLGKVQCIQVGWMYKYIDSYPYTRNDPDIKFNERRLEGVGNVNNTIAIDLSRYSYLANGSSTPIDGLEYTEGCVLRSEDYGKRWYVDGKLVAPFTEQRWTNTTKDWKNLEKSMTPMISVKGEMEITCVDFFD